MNRWKKVRHRFDLFVRLGMHAFFFIFIFYSTFTIRLINLCRGSYVTLLWHVHALNSPDRDPSDDYGSNKVWEGE